nr:hypothetical protein [Tanacetum cinerariifolium]
MLDKLKLDGEVEADEEEATKEVIKGYKTLRENNDPGVFTLPNRLKAKINSFALADIGLNINVMPYQIYTNMGREEAKPIGKKITTLDYLKAEPIQQDKDIEEEEYSVKRDKNGKAFYRLAPSKYLNCDDPLDRALALLEALNPFKGGGGDGMWHTKIRVVDPYENVYDQGCETKATGRELSKYYKLSDIMFPKGLRSDENLNARVYWLSISSDEKLHLSRSFDSTIRSPILIVLMITYGLCQRTTGGPPHSMQDLYDKMGNMEIRQGTLERMTRRELYHTNRYVGLFEHIAGHYGYTLQGAYAPPIYDKEQQDDEE